MLVRLLTRIVEWDHDGIRMEGDPRHAEIIIKQFEVEDWKTAHRFQHQMTELTHSSLQTMT